MTFGKGRNLKVKKKREKEREIQQQGLTEVCLTCGSLPKFKNLFRYSNSSLFVDIAVCRFNTNIQTTK